MTKLLIGTSGFKFDDWKGTFYPTDLKPSNWLNYYAERFNCLEVNASYYRLIHPATFYQMAKKAPEGFEFTVKAYRSLTHEPARGAGLRPGIGAESESDFETFVESLKPLLEAGKFGCVLAQFPSSFRNTAESRAYLAELQDKFRGFELPLVVEFRNREWIAESVFEFMREHQVGFCAVDEPQFKTLMPPIAMATSDIGYVRFHGRNYEKWWKGGESGKERYDYLYSQEELQEWVPKIQQIAESSDKVYVFMNNCFQGQAAKNAVQMRELLQKELGIEIEGARPSQLSMPEVGDQ